MTKEFSVEIEKYINSLNLKYEIHGDSITVRTSPYVGISLKLRIDNKDFLHIEGFARTNSAVYDGERTDLHDILPLIFALMLRNEGYCSSAIMDLSNPATGSDCEIYARYIVPVQFGKSLIDNSIALIKRTEDLVFILFQFEQFIWASFNGCPCTDCRKQLGFRYTYRNIDKKKLKKIEYALEVSKNINYCERTLPTWLYYRNFDFGVTLLNSKDLISLIRVLSVEEHKVIDGITGELIITNNFKNYVSSSDKQKLKNYFLKLADKPSYFIPYENKIWAIGAKYSLIIDSRSGINEFKAEKEKIRERHKKECAVLFSPSNFIWVEKINDSLFENLIKDLLERETNVVRVRKFSNTNESDGGVDLIAEWLVPLNNKEIDEKTLYRKIKVVVQCKAYQKGVSKSHVTDIRDTVEIRNYDGYFLAVSSYTRKSLSEHLDKIRSDGKIWIDWWTKDEIEERLTLNEDLVVKYSAIVKSQNFES